MGRFKVYSFALIGSLIGSLIGIQGCKSFKGAEVNVTPNPLEVHADSVKFTVKASIPPKSGFKKKGVYYGRLVIKGGGGEYEVGRVTISSEQYPDLNKVGASASYNGAVAYQEGMNGGNLIAENRYERKKKKIDLPELTLAPCCITTSRLVATDDQVIFEDVSYQPRTPISLEAKFQFPKDVFKIQPTEYEKAEIRAIGDFLNKKYEATKVVIEGFASPEGTFRRNRFLSVNRAREVQQWLIDQLKKAGYKVYLDSTFFEFRTTTEDWDGFLANLEKLNLPEDRKKQIIQIVAAGYEPEVTERKVMAIVGGEEKVEFILAPLRRATIRLMGYTGKHTDQQIDSLVAALVNGQISDQQLVKEFDQEEIRYAAQRQKDNLDAQIRLMRAYIRAYPDDFRGYNDLGAYLILKGLYDEALEYLTQANAKKPNHYAVLNNIGVVHKAKKNYQEALVNLSASYSAKATPQAAFNLGVVYEKKAMYKEAAEMFGNATTIPLAKYNSGLSKLLMGDLAGAKADLESSIRSNQNHALSYYVLAIVGARSAETNLLTINLKKAIQLDNNLGKKARQDLEFQKYWNTPEFQATVGS
jgi:tetratricopeptide (TPR) repeat protein